MLNENNKKTDLSSLQNCFSKPQRFYGFGKTIDYIVCFDENGTSLHYKRVAKLLERKMDIPEDIRFFTLTGCLFDRKDLGNAKVLLRAIKRQYWHQDAENVLFHSRDIRKRDKQFFLADQSYYRFLGSLSTALEFVTCVVFSITFDLERYVSEGYGLDPYAVAFDLLTPQIMRTIPKGKRLAYVFESRGKREDDALFDHAREFLMERGTKTMSPDVLQRAIRGVFFVEKKTSKDPKNVYAGIEVADLFSYPIHRFARYGTKGQDFEIVERKIEGYPAYFSRGLLLFPDSWLLTRVGAK